MRLITDMGRTFRYRKSRKSQQNLIKDQPSPRIHHDLYKYLGERGWRNENYLTVSSFKDTGRGLYAKKDVIEHEVLIELPFECMISVITLESDEKFVELFDVENFNDLKAQLSFQALLAFYLSYHKGLDEQSQWSSYIKTLPASFTTPYFCKKSELYHLTENLLRMVVNQNNSIKSQYEIVRKLLKKECEHSLNLDTFKWAYFAVNSRSVFISWKSLEPLVEFSQFKDLLMDEPKMALAPLLDLLNHSDRVKSDCQLSHADGFIEANVGKIKAKECKLTYQLTTRSAFKKYEQVFINYGTHNNTKLLFEYGFIVPDNQIDFLEFSLDDINSYIKTHDDLKLMTVPKHKYKFIRDHNLDNELYIDINDGLNHNFQAILSILLLPQNLYNLTQVAFGDDLNFYDVKNHAIKIVENKKNEIKIFHDGLIKLEDLSESALMCLKYFEESIKLIDKVLITLT